MAAKRKKKTETILCVKIDRKLYEVDKPERQIYPLGVVWVPHEQGREDIPDDIPWSSIEEMEARKAEVRARWQQPPVLQDRPFSWEDNSG